MTRPRYVQQIENIAVGIVGLWTVSRMVSPGRNTAEVVNAVNAGFTKAIKVAIGERYIEERNVPRFLELLGPMDDPTMTELFAGLSETDLDWVEQMLGGMYD